MIEFEIKIPDELLNMNLSAAYIEARKRRLIPAMNRSVEITQANVKGLVPEFSGAARASLMHTATQSPARTVGKVTTTMRRPNIYIFVLNAGVAPGKKQPPVDSLVSWVMKKGLASDRAKASKVAYVIARSIKRKGLQGRSFMWTGLSKSEGKIEDLHRQAVLDITKDLSHA
jgi:hypothetical protein